MGKDVFEEDGYSSIAELQLSCKERRGRAVAWGKGVKE